jgi:hypothetical protein
MASERRRTKRFRPVIDALEARAVPSTIGLGQERPRAVHVDVARTNAKLGTKTFVYSGVAVATVQVRDRFLNVVGYGHYTTRVAIAFGKPISAPGFRESNPFSMVLNSLGGPNYGNISLQSAGVFTTLTGRQLGVRFLSYGLSRTSFSGREIFDSSQLGGGANLLTYPKEILYDYLPNPAPIAVGTTFAGRFSGNRLTMVISGNTTDLFHPFSIQITAVSSRPPVFSAR